MAEHLDYNIRRVQARKALKKSQQEKLLWHVVLLRILIPGLKFLVDKTHQRSLPADESSNYFWLSSIS
jgi:hypothetical protein